MFNLFLLLLCCSSCFIVLFSICEMCSLLFVLLFNLFSLFSLQFVHVFFVVVFIFLAVLFLSGGEHTDFGSVTVLLLEDGVEGLEVSRQSLGSLGMGVEEPGNGKISVFVQHHYGVVNLIKKSLPSQPLAHMSLMTSRRLNLQTGKKFNWYFRQLFVSFGFLFGC